jgi:hypothetical protein
MSLLGKRHAQAPPSVSRRWRQVYDAGELLLEHFSEAELDCVALDPQSLPERERGPALQSVTPLLTRLGAAPAASAAAPGQPTPATGTGRDAEILATAAAGLEKRGFIRPGPPGPVTATLADELGGVAADPASPGGVRAVTIVGDLAIVTRMRSQPCWVAEALISPEPTRPDPAAAQWRLVGRMYAAYRPSAVLVETPRRPDGSLPPFAALWQPNAARLIGRWCGVDPAQTADPQRRAYLPPGGQVPSAQIASGFASVHFLRVVHPAGQQVGIRSMITAAAPGRLWVLEGDRAKWAVPVSIDQLAPRIDELVIRPDDRSEAG